MFKRISCLLGLIVVLVFCSNANAFYLNKNYSYSALASGITAGASSLTVSTGTGALFPSGGSFICVIWGSAYQSPLLDINREIIIATRTGDVFTISARAQENTSAKAWSAGDKIASVITAGKIDELEAYMQDHQGVYATTTGINTYSISFSPQFSSLATGDQINVRFTNASTGACTLNVDGLGAKKLYTSVHGIYSQAIAGSVFAGMHAILSYESTLDSANGGWIVKTVSPEQSLYYPDYLAADQGLTGASNTIKYYVDLIGATNKATIYLRHNSGLEYTDYVFSTAETVTSNITIVREKGARIVPTNCTVTIESPYDAGLDQSFNCIGTGKVVFGAGSVKEVYPEMWGDSATNDAPYIQAAVNSLPTGTIYGGGTIVLSQTYVIDTQITVGGYLVQGNIIFKGSFGHAGYPAQIKSGATIGTTPLFYITGIGITFDGVVIQGDGVLAGGAGATTVAIKVGDGSDQATNPDEFKFINGGINFCETAIELNSRNFYIRDNIFSQDLNPIKIPGLEGSTPYDCLDRRDYFIQRNNFHVSTGTCISLTGTKTHAEVWVTDNHFKEVTNGFYGAIESSTISRNNFDIIKGKAIEVPLNSYYTNVRGVDVSHNIITGYQGAGGNTGDAISIKGGSYIFPTVIGNKIHRKSGNGITIQAAHSVISGNTVSKSLYHGLQITGAFATISGNIIVDNDTGDSGLYNGIELAGNYATIGENYSGNTTTAAAGGAQVYGIHIASGSQLTRIGINNGGYNKTSFMLDEGAGTYGFVGDGIARRLTTGIAVPVAGTWAVGDYIINRAPSVAGGAGSQYIIHGWHCTVAGTPGTWVEVRTLTGT